MFNSMFSGIFTAAGMVAAGIVAALALFFLFQWVKGRQRTAASAAWSSTTGRVIAASVVRSARTGNSGGAYYPSIMYQYQVNGQQYTGNRLHFGARMGTGFYQQVQARVNEFPVGSAVTVYYDPSNPADAVLERTTSGGALQLIMVMVLFGAALLVAVQFGGLRLFR
ncbi:MAG: DUF3592 domain-containing protein [bacterium]|nr:DUF3592 domain-containing protein [bacterium]